MAAAQKLAPTPNPPAGMVRVFESTEHTVGEPEERSPISFGPQRAPEPTILVNDAKRYQEIDGFGASVTDSSAWLLRNKLSDSQFQKLMERLFDREKGIGLSLLRQPIGSSDFALEDYTYDDMPPVSRMPNCGTFPSRKTSGTSSLYCARHWRSILRLKSLLHPGAPRVDEIQRFSGAGIATAGGLRCYGQVFREICKSL
jgi:hypothetical protein